MMKSMTGYGRGESHYGGWKFTVELNSVNRKQSDIVIDLPREIIELEPRIRDVINTVISRGRLHVVVVWHRSNGTRTSEVKLDESIAKAYLCGLKKLKHSLRLNGSIDFDILLRCPGVLKLTESEVNPGAIWPYLEKALTQALSVLVKMRKKEGRHLHRDLMQRMDLLGKGVQTVKNLAPAMVERYREQLHERIRKSGIDLSFEDERLMKEVVFFSDRSDITEELTRLESHLAQFRESLHASEPIGRALDFLSQEINREINTIGSKANHAEISQTVVAMKTELERVREQIQNVE